MSITGRSTLVSRQVEPTNKPTNSVRSKKMAKGAKLSSKQSSHPPTQGGGGGSQLARDRQLGEDRTDSMEKNSVARKSVKITVRSRGLASIKNLSKISKK